MAHVHSVRFGPICIKHDIVFSIGMHTKFESKTQNLEYSYFIFIQP